MPVEQMKSFRKCQSVTLLLLVVMIEAIFSVMINGYAKNISKIVHEFICSNPMSIHINCLLQLYTHGGRNSTYSDPMQ